MRHLRLLLPVIGAVLFLGLIFVLNYNPVTLSSELPLSRLTQELGSTRQRPQIAPFDLIRDGDNLGLTDEECEAKFPSGFDEIELAARREYIGGLPNHTSEDGKGLEKGYTQARIYNGHVCFAVVTNTILCKRLG